MNEVILLTSSKESNVVLVDCQTWSVSVALKHCVADSGGTVCLLGRGRSGYSGDGAAGDYVAVAQAKKPLIHIWQWGKPQVMFACHVQEIVTSMASDFTGVYLFAGMYVRLNEPYFECN